MFEFFHVMKLKCILTSVASLIFNLFLNGISDHFLKRSVSDFLKKLVGVSYTLTKIMAVSNFYL